MEETRQLGGGLVRFGIERKKLHPWPKIGRKARISKQQIKVMESTGCKEGANPTDWYGTTIPMSLDKITTIEVMNDSGVWEKIEWDKVRKTPAEYYPHE